MTTNQAFDTRKLNTEIVPIIQLKSEKLLVLEATVLPLIDESKEIRVRTPEERKTAYLYLQRNKKMQSEVSDFFKEPKVLSDAIHSFICSLENSLLKNGLRAAEQRIKLSIGRFDEEEERIRLTNQARLQAEEDARAERERQAILKKADQVKRPEKREMYRQQAAEVAPNVVTVASPVEKQEGESKRTSWKATLTSMKELATAAANGNDVALSFLEFNESAARTFSAATGGNVSIPGVIFEKYSILTVKI